MASVNDLKTIRQLPMQIERIRMNIKRLRESAARMGGSGDGMPRNPSRVDRMAEYMARLDELEREYQDKIMVLEEARKRLDDEMDMLEPAEAKMVQFHAIDGKSYLEIARIIHMSDSTVRRHYKRAVEKLAVNGHILRL